MNLWRKIESYIKPWMLVTLFLLILLFGLYKEGQAAEVEIGPTFLSGQFSKGAIVLLGERFDKWYIGMGVSSGQEVTDRSGDTYHPRTNLFVHGQRMVKITENFDFGLGVGYFNAKTRWNGSNFVASLSIEYEITDHWSVKFRHWSNAGSASPNMGQDAFTIGYSFQ